MVSEHLKTFLDKPVKDYDSSTPLDPENYVYRLSVEYDSEETITGLLDTFAKDPKAGTVKELIIGRFMSNDDLSDDSADVVQKLADLSGILASLKALFIGDITYEECEISWIKQTDMTPILGTYPELEHLQVRGSDGLTFTGLQHGGLKTLIVETGGLPPNVVEQVGSAHLPNLERLDLWLGSPNYGFDSKIEDFASILTGSTFPKLTHLGLMDSEIEDDVAIAVAQAPILNQLKTLDLSMGNLSDRGAAALLANDAIRKLKSLNLRHHYLSDDMMAKFQGLGIAVNLDDQEEAEEEDDRYAEVTE